MSLQAMKKLLKVTESWSASQGMITCILSWKTKANDDRLNHTMDDYVQCAEDWTTFMQTRVYTVGLRRLAAILIRKERLACRRTLWRIHDACRTDRVQEFILTTQYMDERLHRSRP